ncbi:MULTISPECIES: TRAP transporter small permease subunit [unclassified Mesorhizobium]|uniref:TRAP transporter small permease n=2 Tax=Mesorhizobium TaxID=68287 RepID=UPI001FE03780|nr:MULTISPECIES: TRAP transporter small permease subunit [unclassified Mesorhizobium]
MMERTGRFLALALSVVGVGVISLLIVATGLGAIGRYLHLNGVTWSFELVGMLFLWTTAIGAVLAEIAGENVSIDGNSITSSRGAFFRVYHNLILLIVAAAMVWSGSAMLGRTGFVPTPVMRAPSWTVHSTIVFMGLCLGAVAITRIVRIFR